MTSCLKCTCVQIARAQLCFDQLARGLFIEAEVVELCELARHCEQNFGVTCDSQLEFREAKVARRQLRDMPTLTQQNRSSIEVHLGEYPQQEEPVPQSD